MLIRRSPLRWLDQIRPDWEAKLTAVRAQAQRRANRRIIMRQVGDRLIPVGVTSGRVHALTEDGGGGDAEGSRSGSRRRRRNQGQNPALDRLLGQVDIAGQDLEEVGPWRGCRDWLHDVLNRTPRSLW